MASGTLSVQRVVATCRDRAAEFRASAKQYSHSRNRDLELEYLGMALAAERLADEFEAAITPTVQISPDEVEARARDFNPTAFARFAGMLDRLRGQGVDEGEAARSAQITYGPEMDEARRAARRALESERDADGDQSAYDRGFEDAILWHEERAREAENLAAQEQNGERKAKLRQRAERHRLYARHMRSHQAERIAALQRSASHQRQLDAQQQALPLEVQAAFLKRTDNVAGEAFD